MRRAEGAVSGFEGTRAGARSLAGLGKALGDLDGWAPAGTGLREIRAVPTIFPHVDHVLGVGGWPTDRFGLVHGESNEGKTTFVLGLILSFLLRGHAAALIDAERSTPASWVRKLFPAELVDSPAFRVHYPTTYEETRVAVRKWAEAIGEARAKGEIDADTTGVLVLDSIRKLVPKRLLEALLKDIPVEDEDKPRNRFAKKKAGGVDGMNGMAARYKAALNAAWMDELTVLLAQTGTCMVAIGREYKASDTGGSLSFGDDFVLGGGSSLFFESSVVARVGVEKGLYVGPDGEKRLVGEQHFVQVRKTKIAGKVVRYPLAHFHTSNGAEYPFGFDRGRDLLEVGQSAGVVELNGAWYWFGKEKLGQGDLAAAKKLAGDPGLLERLEFAVRATFPVDATTAPHPAPEVPAKKPGKKAKGRRA